MKAIVVLFIMLHKVDLTFQSVDETLVCDHSHESYWAVLFIMLYKVVFYFNVWPYCIAGWKHLGGTFASYIVSFSPIHRD